MLSAEATAQFQAGEGGPLATSSNSLNGVYGPPIGMWRTGSLISVIGLVRHSQLPQYCLFSWEFWITLMYFY